MPDAIQDFYPDDVSHCYGCGRLNERGLQIKTHWDGKRSVTRYSPRAEHMAVPGYVYGGLLASLIDCHGTGTAAAALYDRENRPYNSEPPIRCLTASLNVEYMRPTPLGPELQVRGEVAKIEGNRVTVSCTVFADDVATVSGTVIAVAVPTSYLEQLATQAT
jgi:acyl-coenzyme A thioesterase PaaI-like protein